MNSFRDLEIYKLAFELALKVHKASLLLPYFELYEQGSQIRQILQKYKRFRLLKVLAGDVTKRTILNFLYIPTLHVMKQ